MNDSFDDRDQQKIERLTRDGEQIEEEFQRSADELGVDNHTPHIYHPHESAAKRCRAAIWPAHAIGGLVCGGWSYVTSSSPITFTICALLLYALFAYLLNMALTTSFTRRTFIARFKQLFLPPFVVTLLSGAVLLTERFAGPELADKLLTLDPYAWIGLEIGALITGAVAVVGAEFFGWSGTLTRAHEACHDRIAQLERTIRYRRDHDDKRRGDGPGPVAAATVAIMMLGAGVAFAECPTVMVDATGSLNLSQLNDQLIAPLTSELAASTIAGQTACARLVLFSQDVFAAPRVDIKFPAIKPHYSKSIRDAEIARARKVVGDQIKTALAAPPPIASCSSLPDMLMRAAAEGRTLLITDAKHSCGPLTRTKFQIEGDSAVVVVLIRSNGDTGASGAIFERRSRQILTLLPEAIVLPAFQLETAMKRLFTAPPQPSLTATISTR